MKQIENLIKRLVKEELLRESALTPEDLLLKDYVVRVLFIRAQNLWRISCENRTKEKSNNNSLSFMRPLSIGLIQIQKTKQDCSGAFEVTWSEANVKGLGPLLYDVAMEVASMQGSSLTSDRDEVSQEAQNVWRYYDKNRGDIEKIQLDNERGELTPDDSSDDCEQSMSRKISKVAGVKWNDVSTSRAYKKKGTPVIDKLRELGIFYDSGSV